MVDILLAALAIWIALGQGAPATPVNLFNSDGRDPRMLQSQIGLGGRPYAPIGQVITKGDVAKFQNGVMVRGRSSGTATLIAPCFALTSAHEVFGNGATDFEELIFRSVSQDGKTLVDTDAWPVAWGATRKFGDDWALVRLTRCEGRRLGWIDISDMRLGDVAKAQFESAGFPVDREANRLWRDPKCRVYNFDIMVGLLATDCAARAGASGAPVLTRTDKGSLRMVGMIVQETNPSAEIIRQYEKGRANLAIYVRSIWPQVEPWLKKHATD